MGFIRICAHWLRVQALPGQLPRLGDGDRTHSWPLKTLQEMMFRSQPGTQEALSRVLWFLPPFSPLLLSETLSFLAMSVLGTSLPRVEAHLSGS